MPPPPPHTSVTATIPTPHLAPPARGDLTWSCNGGRRDSLGRVGAPPPRVDGVHVGRLARDCRQVSPSRMRHLEVCQERLGMAWPRYCARKLPMLVPPPEDGVCAWSLYKRNHPPIHPLTTHSMSEYGCRQLAKSAIHHEGRPQKDRGRDAVLTTYVTSGASTSCHSNTEHGVWE